MGLVDTVLELCISHKLQTPRLAYDTGRKMWLPKFSLFGHLLAEKVKTQPELILSAEVSWKYFSRVAHIFIAECKDPEIAHARASGWKLENYKPVARQLASIVSEDINLAYDVGAKFPDERFEPIKDIIYERVLSDLRLSLFALSGWNSERSSEFSSYAVQKWGEVIVDRVEGFTKREKIIWSDISNEMDVKVLEGLPISETKIVIEAYGFALQNRAEDYFFKNFKTVIQDGNVKPWAEHIINHFEEPAIGGDTYRIA
jgi:hypothetical protein